jgi:hypothetical protein
VSQTWGDGSDDPLPSNGIVVKKSRGQSGLANKKSKSYQLIAYLADLSLTQISKVKSEPHLFPKTKKAQKRTYRRVPLVSIQTERWSTD